MPGFDGPEAEAQDNVAQLGVVPKARAEPLIQAQVVEQLRSTLALAEAGEVTSLFIVVNHPDGTYSEVASATVSFTQTIGQLEIIKQNWIGRYLASLTPAPVPGAKR